MDEIQKEYEAVFEEINNHFNLKVLPKLRNLFSAAASNIANLMDVLVRKSLLKKDYYNYDAEDRSKFYLPEQKNFAEQDTPTIIYSRLQATIWSLEYQATNTPLSVTSTSDEFLENTRKIIFYFQFQNLSSSAAGINTRTLRVMIDRVHTLNDDVFSRIVNDTLKLLTENFKTLQKYTEELIHFRKLRYKTLIRLNVFPIISAQFPEDVFRQDPEAYIKKTIALMKETSPEIPIHSRWIGEALHECFKTDVRKALEKLKAQYLTEKQKKKAESSIKSDREKLLLLISKLTETRKPLEHIHYTLTHNLNLIAEKETGMLAQIKQFFSSIFHPQAQEEDHFFHIEYLHPQSKKILKDTINIIEFLDSITKEINIFSQITKKDSAAYTKVHQATEESLLKFIEKHTFELIIIKERASGIIIEIRLRAPKKKKSLLLDCTETLQSLNDSLTDILSRKRHFILEKEKFKMK